MSLTITIDRTQDDRFRAVFLGIIVEASSLDELMEDVKHKVLRLVHSSDFTFSETAAVSEAGNSEDEDDAGFEADLEYTLAKNAELYRRLAR